MFVVCGEALMDVFAVCETGTGITLDARIGGSPFNVALGLARLGQPVSFFGAVGKGFLGERLMRAFIEEGVLTGSIVRTEAPTTISLVGLDARGVPSYSFYGEGSADRQLNPQDLSVLPPQMGAIHFGSFATVVEPIASTLRELIEREHARGAQGAVISYDPNIRLNVEPNVQRWRDHLQWMLPRTQVFKISDEDAGLLFPGEPVEALAAQWLASGVPFVIVTRGAQGALAWCKAGPVVVPPIKVEVIDTVGAGDTFQAALLTWLAEHELLRPASLAGISTDHLAQAVGFAVKAAAITCSRRGADLPRRAELP